MLNYITQHWQGKNSLAQAFWLNLVVLFAALDLIERFVFPPYIENELVVTVAVILYVIVVKLMVYPWQVVGVLRACDLRIKSNSGRTWATAAQMALVVSLALTLVTTIEIYQKLQFFNRNIELKAMPQPEPEYSLSLVEQGALIHLQGPFQIGITRKVEELLAHNPAVVGIILDSEGGQIYEGRGLARLIREYELQTFSLGHCLSSCTTAFVSGTTRTLGPDAKLGFHQYKTYSLIPSINVENEQAKDMAIFEKQGVSPEFLEKIFEYAPDRMWWPEIDELKAAGVVHQTGFSLRD